MSILQKLCENEHITIEGTRRKLIIPSWMIHNIHYETIMGSMAYGVSEDASDFDIYAMCIPPKSDIFPHLNGHIIGFGPEPKRFTTWQQHHIYDSTACSGNGRSYDFQVYGIVQYFNLCMDCNPNMIDSLFTPERCVLSTTSIGRKIKDNRRLFLNKKVWYTFRGYAHQQLHKMTIKKPMKGSKRYEDVQKHGFDCKFAYHIVRLLMEVEQIMAECDLELERKDRREILKEIRRGEWTEEQIRQFFSDKEKQLEELYHKSDLPNEPRYNEIRVLLVECLEMHFGSLNSIVYTPGIAENALLQIKKIVENIGS